MKKIVLLIGLLILLTGCTAEVNINVSSSGIYEQVNIVTYANQTLTKEQLSSAFREYVPAFGDVLMADGEADIKKDGISYYSRNMSDIGSGYKTTYGYKFGFDEYNRARTVKEGFKDAIIQSDTVDKQIMFTTDSSGIKYFGYYPELENIKINITSEYAVKESNADYVNNGVYTWVFTKNTKKSVYIVFDNPNALSSPKKDDNNDGEVVDNKNNSNSTTIVGIEEEEEKGNVVTRFMNEHPLIVMFIAIAFFLILVIIISKISKVNLK